MTKQELEFIGVERVKEIHKMIWNGVIDIIRDIEESDVESFDDIFAVVGAKQDVTQRMYEEGEISLYEYNALCDVGCHCALCLASEMLADYRELPDNDDAHCLFCKEAGITNYDGSGCLDGEYFRICTCMTKRVALTVAENIRDIVNYIEFEEVE